MGVISWFNGALALFLAVALAFAGQAKITDLITPSLHAELNKAAVQWAKNFQPFFSLPPSDLKQLIGITELVSAAGLVIGGLIPFFRKISALVGAGVMLGAVYFHYNTKDFEHITPPAVLAGVAVLTYLTTFAAKSAKPTTKKTQ